MAHLSLFLFGAPRIEADGAPVSLDRSKAVALLGYLAVTGTPHSRDFLATLFWPDYDQSRAYAYLRRTLWAINSSLGEGWIKAGREAVELDKSRQFYLDVEHFQNLLSTCQQHNHPPEDFCRECEQRLVEAAGLYQNDFLAGFSLRDSAEFDEWQSFQTESLRRDFAGVLEKLANCRLASGDFGAAVQYARRWLALDALHEDAHRLLMLTLALSGDRNAALRQFQAYSRLTAEELGISPQDETKALYRKIKSGEVGPTRKDSLAQDRRAESSVSAASPGRHTQLPSPGTPFVGRPAELHEIEMLLQNPECRLLTLLGPGGVGKTRLSLRAAELALEQNGLFRHGVCFVPLAPLDSSENLIPTLAEALRISILNEQRPDVPRQDLEEQILYYLQQKQLMLVLDNFEHLMQSAGWLSTLLAEAPGLQILVTSRERLNLYEEWVLEISGMETPTDEKGAAEDLGQFAAVELFIKNARRANSAFRASPRDIEIIARICRLVEGMPLAIELASAWVKALPVEEIAREIEQNLDFLSTSYRNVPERHSSLRLVFEHSWKLLDGAEKETLKKLSVFRGSFGREAAQQIGGASLAMLSALVDKSLLHLLHSQNHSGSYEMHELVKQYAAEKLNENPAQKEKTLAVHTGYYAALLEQALPALHGENQLQTVELLDAELENLRAAWNRAADQGNISALKQAAYSLMTYLDIKGRLREVRDLMAKGAQRLRAIREQESPGEEMDGLYAAILAAEMHFSLWLTGSRDLAAARECLQIMGALARPEEWMQVYLLLDFGEGILDDDKVFDLFQQTVEVFNKNGDRWGIAASQLVFGAYSRDILENNDLAIKLWKEARAGFFALGDRFSYAICLNSLAAISYETGSYDEAYQMAEESLEIYRVLGDRWRMVGAFITLGHARTAMGIYPEAEQYYQQGLLLAREIGNPFLIAVLLDCLGYTAFLNDDYEKAETHYFESRGIYTNMKRFQGLGMALSNLGDIARMQNNLEKAQDFYMQAVQQFMKAPALRSWELWGMAIAQKKLGLVFLLQARYAEAQEQFKLALHKAREVERTPEVLDILVGEAELLARTGALEKAVELLTLIVLHSAAAEDTRLRTQRLLDDLSAELPHEILYEASERGRAAHLDTLLFQLLPEEPPLG